MILRELVVLIFVLPNEEYLRYTCGLTGRLGQSAVNKKGECYD